VTFELEVAVPLSPQEAWNRLNDWPSHGKWIPLTRIDVDAADPARFVAWSGIRPLVLEDRMHQLSASFDGAQGESTVAKLGPVLVGEARFAVRPSAHNSQTIVSWYEDVHVKWLPKFLSRPVAFLSAKMFAAGVKKMAKY
jgi:hypothetical protein